MSVIMLDPEETQLNRGYVSPGIHMTELRCPSCREPRPGHTAECDIHPADIRQAFDYDDPVSSLVFL